MLPLEVNKVVQITPYVIHEFGEFAEKFNFITTLLVTKFGGTRSPWFPVLKSWGTGPSHVTPNSKLISVRRFKPS